MPRRLSTLLLLLLVPVAASHAAPARAPFRLGDALTLGTISDLTWSANGERLAFVVSSPDTAEDTNNQDVWLLDLADGRTTRLTRHPKNDFSPSFSPGGDSLVFIANRATGDDARPGLWMLSLRGGDPWPVATLDESVGEVAWSPDGRSLAYVKIDTLPRSLREARKKKADAVTEDQRLQLPQLWVLDLASGRSRRLTGNERYVWYVRWSPDSKHVAFLTSPTGKPDDSNVADIGVVASSGGPVRTLDAIGAPFAWSPDGRWIAWASGGDRTQYIQKTDLWVESVAGGAPINLTAGFDGDVSAPAWSPNSDSLYFHAALGASTEMVALARKGGPVQLEVDRRGAAGDPVLAANGRMAWVQSSPTEASEVWVANHPAEQGHAATRLHAAISGLALGTTRTVHWTSSDGVTVEGLLVRPPGAAASGPLKTLVYLHGGPYGSRFNLGFQPNAQWFAANGYQVFMPNFRSSEGYGTAFLLRKRSDWGFQDWRDVMTGIDSLVKWRLADSTRLGVFGHSYGAYLSAWAITQTHRFDAAVVWAGAVDLAAHYGQSDIQKYRAFDFGGAPWETPAHWARSSPMSFIANAKTPTLILVGENDPRVPYPQSQELYRALTALHVPVEFTHYPREGHTVREPRHRADELQRMLGWWERWIR
jgi:dipeptidyl aminopeptidase/acylaminoacyl peptidase